jgi:hypothetical protein
VRSRDEIGERDRGVVVPGWRRRRAQLSVARAFTIPLASALAVVALRKGLRDRRLGSAALVGAAVVFLYSGVRQWGVPDCSGGSGETGSVTIRPGERIESMRGGLPATPVIVVAVLVGELGVGGLAAYAHAARKAP